MHEPAEAPCSCNLLRLHCYLLCVYNIEQFNGKHICHTIYPTILVKLIINGYNCSSMTVESDQEYQVFLLHLLNVKSYCSIFFLIQTTIYNVKHVRPTY